MIRAIFVLIGTGLVLTWAALRYGGVMTADWNPCALALGAVLMLGYLPFGRDSVAAPVDWLLYGALFAIPAWALMQTVPLPYGWVAALSPERAALARALLRFTPQPGAITLSVRPEITLQYALRYLAFSATFLATRDLMWRMPGHQYLIALPPVLLAATETAVGILQSSGPVTVPVSGTFVNRDHFSALLGMCLPFAASAVAGFAPYGRRTVLSVAGVLAWAAMMTGITLSLSRAGFVVALVTLLLFVSLFALVEMRGRARLLTLTAGLTAVLCAGGLLASGHLLERMIQLSSGDTSWEDRIRFWKETIHVLATYPVTGCGFGGFVSAVTPFRAAAVTRTLDYAHNDYLQFVAEGGIPGFLLAGVATLLVARAGWRGIFRQPARDQRIFAIGCVCALFSGMLHSAVDLITYVPATAMLLCWIAGMVSGLEYRGRSSA